MNAYSEYIYNTDINRSVLLYGSKIFINGELADKGCLSLIPEKYKGEVSIRVYGEKKSKWFKGLVSVEKYADTVTKLDYAHSSEFSINALLPTEVEHLVGTFSSAKGEKYPGIEKWDTSNVISMSFLFYKAKNFNQDISMWDTSNVKSMMSAFNKASAFNQPIGRWDISKVVDMFCMFDEAEAFNQDLRGWDLSNVKDVSYMFKGATSFDRQMINKSTLPLLTKTDTMFGKEDENEGVQRFLKPTEQ